MVQKPILPLALLALLTLVLNQHTYASAEEFVGIDTQTAQDIAVDTYIYCYPLLIMDTTRRSMTIPVSAMGLGPTNRFNHMRSFPMPGFNAVIRPNFDTLYSSAWLDLTREPVVVSVPDTGGRYYVLQMLDMWTDVFADPGKRTTGTEPRDFVVVPPGWQGVLPNGLTEIESPTPHAWIIGRTQTNGRDDFKAVRKIQSGYHITTLSEWTGSPKPVQSTKAKRISPLPFRAVDKMSARVYFRYAAQLLRANPPHASDGAMLARMKQIGFGPDDSFELGDISPALRQAFEMAPFTAQKRMRDTESTIAPTTNGWRISTTGIGTYRNEYLTRAIIAKTALGANTPKDSVYPLTHKDESGRPLHGANRYVVHFTKDALPPVHAFWSVTLYKQTGFPAPNGIGRYAIGDRDPLVFNADGSLDIYIQNESPGKDREANWLPAPRKPFNLAMRLYWPKESVLDGTWTPPPVRKSVAAPDTL